MSKFGIMILIIATLTTHLGLQREALAQNKAHSVGQAFEGPENRESQSPDQIARQSQLPSYGKDCIAYKGNRYLRNAGIGLTILGGAMVIIGSALFAESYNHPATGDLAISTGTVYAIVGANLTTIYAPLVLTPGIIMAVAGHRRMKTALLSPEEKSLSVFRGYQRLRKSGIVLSIIGGVISITGAGLLGRGFTTNCNDNTCPADSGKLVFYGGLATSVGAVAFLIPGLITALVGHKKMKEHRSKKSKQSQTVLFRPTFQGVSLMTPSSGSKSGGFALSFKF